MHQQCLALQLDFVPALTLSPTLSTPLLCIALQSVFSTTSMSSQMHNRYVIKSAQARTLSAYSRYATPSYTYPHGNRVTKKGIKRHRDDLDLFVERDAECRDELRFAGYQELVVDYGQFEGCEFVARRAPPYLKLGFAKNMCLVFSPNMWHAAQSLQNQVGTRGSSNIRGLAGPGFWQAWKSMPYTTYVPLQEGEGLTMTAEDLDTGGVFLFSRPDGMLLVVPPSNLGASNTRRWFCPFVCLCCCSDHSEYVPHKASINTKILPDLSRRMQTGRLEKKLGNWYDSLFCWVLRGVSEVAWGPCFSVLQGEGNGMGGGGMLRHTGIWYLPRKHGLV